MPDGLQLLRPWWLLVLLPLLWLLWRGLHRTEATPWKGVIDPHLLPHLLVPPGSGMRRWDYLLIGVLALAVLALAGPTWEQGPPVQMRANTPPLVIALDLSRSMDANDTPPSRLALARLELDRLLERLPPRPVGLVVFGGAAFRAMPMTEDQRVLRHTLSFLESGIMPAPGSIPAAALERAVEMLSQANTERGDILLVGDRADPNAAEMAAAALAAGFHTSVLAVGTAAGGTILDPDEDLLRQGGEPVVAGFDGEGLRAVAEAGGGVYREITPDDADTAELLAALHPARTVRSDDPEAVGSAWYDRGPWLIALLCPLALFAFRRAGLFVLFPLLGLLPTPAPALEWADLWLNADQRGERALAAGEPAIAFARFRAPLWRGVAAYRNGEYSTALEIFQGLDTPMAHYNRGNTLVRLERFEEARRAFGRTLVLDPGHRDARHNLGRLNAFLEVDNEASLQTVSPRQEEPAPSPTKGPEPSEEPMEVRDRDQLRKLPEESQPRPESPGRAGGGAVLLEGAPHPKQPEGSALGQGLGGRGERESRTGGEPGRSDGEPPPSPAESGDVEPSAPGVDEPGEPLDATESDIAAGNLEPTGQHATAEQSRPGFRPGSESEQRQALEQWLSRIPDTGPGFLREKFLREHQRNPPREREGAPW